MLQVCKHAVGRAPSCPPTRTPLVAPCTVPQSRARSDSAAPVTERAMSQAARQEALLREQEALDAEHEARASIRADVRERLLGLASNNLPNTTQYASGSLVEYEARSVLVWGAAKMQRWQPVSGASWRLDRCDRLIVVHPHVLSAACLCACGMFHRQSGAVLFSGRYNASCAAITATCPSSSCSRCTRTQSTRRCASPPLGLGRSCYRSSQFGHRQPSRSDAEGFKQQRTDRSCGPHRCCWTGAFSGAGQQQQG